MAWNGKEGRIEPHKADHLLAAPLLSQGPRQGAANEPYAKDGKTPDHPGSPPPSTFFRLLRNRRFSRSSPTETLRCLGIP